MISDHSTYNAYLAQVDGSFKTDNIGFELDLWAMVKFGFTIGFFMHGVSIQDIHRLIPLPPSIWSNTLLSAM